MNKPSTVNRRACPSCLALQFVIVDRKDVEGVPVVIYECQKCHHVAELGLSP